MNPHYGLRLPRKAMTAAVPWDILGVKYCHLNKGIIAPKNAEHTTPNKLAERQRLDGSG